MDSIHRQALEEIKAKLISALEQNNAREIHCYHVFRDLAETNALKTQLENLNMTELTPIIAMDEQSSFC